MARVEAGRRRVDGYLRSAARRFALTRGEVAEVLEHLPFGDAQGSGVPEVWQRPVAQRALERYAARKRAAARMASRGRL